MRARRSRVAKSAPTLPYWAHSMNWSASSAAHEISVVRRSRRASMNWALGYDVEQLQRAFPPVHDPAYDGVRNQSSLAS